MLYLSRIKSTQDQYLAPLIELFEKSFPKNERREKSGKRGKEESKKREKRKKRKKREKSGNRVRD